MTGPGKCYDNAKAERINGILKHELGLRRRFMDFDDALKYVEEAVRIYNEERLIITQNYRTRKSWSTISGRDSGTGVGGYRL